MFVFMKKWGSQTWPIKWNAVSSKQRSSRYCYIDALHGCSLNSWRESLTATTQECCKQYWTSPGGNTPQSSSCTATYHPSRKLSKLDGPDMQDTNRDELISDVLLWTPAHDRTKPTYSSSMRILGVALGTYRKRWTIRRGSGISVLVARQDDKMMTI